jgi:DHA1 family tetracycline resistance protein-like MFS transporter
VLIFTVLNQLLFWADNDILLSYLRCALEIEPLKLPALTFRSSLRTVNSTEVVCDTTGQTQVPRHSNDWSGSAHCFDKDYVLNQATNEGSLQSVAAAVSNILVLAFLGSMADSFGRRPILLLTCIGWIANMALLWANAAFVHHFYLVLASTVVRNAVTASDPTLRAMVADITTPARRAAAMSLAYIFQAFGMIIGFGISLFILANDFTNYTWVWVVEGIGAVLLLVASCCFVIETRPKLQQQESRGDFGWHSVNPLQGISLIWRQQHLRWMAVAIVFCSTSLIGYIVVFASFLLSCRGWDQLTAAIPAVAIQPFIIAGAMSNSFLAKRFNLGQVFLFGLGWQVACYLGLAFLAPYSDAMCWLCDLALGVGIGIVIPTYQALCTMGVPPEQQGKVQSIMTIAQSMGQVIGGLVYGPLLFDAGARGVHAGVPFIASAGLNVIAMLIFATLSYPSLPALDKVGQEAQAEKAALRNTTGCPVDVKSKPLLADSSSDDEAEKNGNQRPQLQRVPTNQEHL